MRPAYCIALRPDKQQVLLIVRGTKSIGDAITILTGHSYLFMRISGLSKQSAGDIFAYYIRQALAECRCLHYYLQYTCIE